MSLLAQLQANDRSSVDQDGRGPKCRIDGHFLVLFDRNDFPPPAERSGYAYDQSRAALRQNDVTRPANMSAMPKAQYHRPKRGSGHFDLRPLAALSGFTMNFVRHRSILHLPIT